MNVPEYVTKATLEGLFADELALLQPTPGDMRLLARIDRHSGHLEELDVEGILAFAERVLPRAADLWVQASPDQRRAVPTTVLSGRNRVRRKSIQSNRGNGATFQKLGAGCEC